MLCSRLELLLVAADGEGWGAISQERRRPGRRRILYRPIIFGKRCGKKQMILAPAPPHTIFSGEHVSETAGFYSAGRVFDQQGF
jgi:hypothetical protein